MGVILFDEPEPDEITSEPVMLVALGDAAELTLGQGGQGSEDKRYVYG